jgi:hypothetical protein
LQTRVFDESQWHTLSDLEVEIDGVKRTPRDQDVGILIGGGLDEYTIYAECPISEIQRVRVELVSESGVAHQNELFSLHELQAFLDRGDGEPSIPIQLRFGDDRHHASSELHNVVDNDPRSFWICGNASHIQWAVFSCPDIVNTATGELKFVINTGSSPGLRRLRLSVTDQPIPQTPLSVAWMSAEERGLLTGLVRLSVAFYLAGEAENASRTIKLARANSDPSSEFAWSLQVLEALVLQQQGNTKAAKLKFKEATVPFPRRSGPVFELLLLRLAHTNIDSLDESKAESVAIQFFRDCRIAFLADQLIRKATEVLRKAL